MSDNGHGLNVEDLDRGGRRFVTKVANVLDVPLGQLKGNEPAPQDASLPVAAFNASL